VHGPYAIHVTCGNCRRTKASHRAADAYFLYEHGAEVARAGRVPRLTGRAATVAGSAPPCRTPMASTAPSTTRP
jgi:hypothetical protein